MNKETSARVSSLAARIMSLPMRTIEHNNFTVTPDDYNSLLHDAKTLAGSAMSQDETSGQQPGPGPHKIPHGIHPAPAEFSAAQIALDPILHFFHYAHLPPKLQETSKAFFLLAAHVVDTVPRNAERTVALRKLLEAKDAAVRANLPAPTFEDRRAVASKDEPELGEPREIGGYDESRDGPIPFDA